MNHFMDHQPTPPELLEPHAHRSIRVFLERPGDAEDAFWDVLYGSAQVDHETAVAVAETLERSRKKVQHVLDGWRPAALVRPANAPYKRQQREAEFKRRQARLVFASANSEGDGKPNRPAVRRRVVAGGKVVKDKSSYYMLTNMREFREHVAEAEKAARGA